MTGLGSMRPWVLMKQLGIAFDEKKLRFDFDADSAFRKAVAEADLQAGVLRHVSEAFAEDPVRLLRLARFAARFADFTVAPETHVLLQQLVDDGEVDALVPERVWQELSRGLMEARPSRMFDVLRRCGALAKLLPEVERLWGVPQPPQYHPEVDTGVHLMLVLDTAAAMHAALPVRWACLMNDLGKGTTPPDEWPRHIGHEARSARLAKAVADRLRVPNDCRELADAVAREHGNVHRSGELNAAAVMRLLERCDAIRRRQRFGELLLACECDARGRTGLERRPYPQRARLQQALDAARAVDTAAVAAQAAARGVQGPGVGDAIRTARVSAIGAAEGPAPAQVGNGRWQARGLSADTAPRGPRFEGRGMAQAACRP